MSADTSIAELERFLESLSTEDAEVVRRNMRCAPPSGFYRPIYQSFLNHVRTRLLSDVAFRVLIVMRAEFHPAGLERRYGINDLLQQHLLYSADKIEDTLAELEAMEFIRRDVQDAERARAAQA